jgi:iron complex outermembrane recepter protein
MADIFGRALPVGSPRTAWLFLAGILAAPQAAIAQGIAQGITQGTAQGSASGDPITLPTLSIEGRPAETARGPVQGYVAQRSATGTKTDTPLIETPQSISVITSDQIEALNIGSINEALRYSPGAFVSGTDYRGEYFTVRGFPADVYLDGMRVPAPVTAQSFRIEPWGMERIELLRGTSSALYGQANLGGIVNAVSKTPYLGQLNQVALQGGSFGRIQGMWDVGGKLSEGDGLLWRMVGLVRSAGTEFDATRDDRIYIAPSLRWQPSKDTSVVLQASYLHDNNGVTGQWLPPQGTALYNPNGTIPRGRITGEPDWDTYRKTQLGLGYQVEHRLTEAVTLRQNLRYTYVDLDYKSIYASGLSPANQWRTVSRVASYQVPISQSLTVDNQAEARFGTGPLQHTALFGLDYRWQRVANRTWAAAATRLDVYAPVYGYVPTLPLGSTSTTLNNQIQNQLGLYAQDQIRWDNWILTLTGRQDWASVDTQNKLSQASSTQNDSAFTGRVALLYASPIGVSPYVSYATSFLPTLGTMAPQRGGGTFKPTTGDQVEVGVKYQPPGTESLFTAALYELTQQNVTTTDLLFPQYSIQTGEARSRGLELEARVALTEGLSVIGAYTAQDTEVTKSTTNNLGRRLATVPNHMASLWGDYSYKVTEELTLGFGAGLRYVGNIMANNAPTAANPIFHAPSYTLFDAMLRADYRQWRLTVTGTNLGDENYFAACYATSCSYGVGRAVYATLAYRW